MVLRTQQDLQNSPCAFKLKDFEKQISDPSAPSQPTAVKVKKLIPKLDENGNIIYKTVKIPVKKGCGCKGKAQETEIKEQRVPEMIEVEDVAMTPSTQKAIDTALNVDASKKYIICKLYGTVKAEMCENCKTYRAK